MSLWFMHAAEWVRIFLSSVGLNDSPLYIQHIWCILSSANGHLGYFKVWASLSNAGLFCNEHCCDKTYFILDLVTYEDMFKIEMAELYSEFVYERSW